MTLEKLIASLKCYKDSMGSECEVYISIYSPKEGEFLEKKLIK